MQNGTPQPVARFRNRKLQKTQREHLFPKQICVMLGAVPQLQCLTEEALLRAYENPTYLQLKILKYQQTFPLTEEESLCTYKKRFCNKTWKQTVRVITFSACKLCIYFTHRNGLSDFQCLSITDKTTGQHDTRDQETRGQGLFLPFATMTSRGSQGPAQN